MAFDKFTGLQLLVICFGIAEVNEAS